jgi:hypothetical protein
LEIEASYREIRELLFQRDQTMNSEELIYSNDPNSDPEMPNIHDVDMESLNAASRALEESLAKMEKREMQMYSEKGKPIGLVPTTHEAIHSHSSRVS